MKAHYGLQIRICALIALVGACLFGLPVISGAIKISYVPKTVQQADGSTLSLFMSGDEYFNYLHTSNGSIVRQDPDGYYTYCVVRFDGVLQPGSVRVDMNPMYKGLTIENVNIEANAQAKEQMEHVTKYTQPKYSINGRKLAAASPALH